MKLALFDIDGTLTTLPSCERAFAKYLWRHGELGLHQYLHYLYFLGRYLSRYKGLVFKMNKAYLSGTDQERITAMAADFVDLEVIPGLCPSVRDRLETHLRIGDQVAFLSGTLDIIATPLAHRLGVSLVESTPSSFHHKQFAFAPPSQHPFGHQKLLFAARLAAKTNLPLSQAVAYCNSIHDHHLLEAVGKAVVVNPDKKLKAMALTNGWEVLEERPGRYRAAL